MKSLAVSMIEPATDLRRMDWGVPATLAAAQWFLSRAFATAGIVSCLAVLISLLATCLPSGFTLTFKPLTPNWEKISLTNGWDKLFSVESALRGGIATLKVCSAVAVVSGLLIYNTDEIRQIGQHGTALALVSTGHLLGQLMLRLAAVALVWGFADFGLRHWRHEQKLKMSRQEIKDEQKDDQADPHIRARMRRVQIESIQRRALADVPRATLVITNPTHFAVALKYESGRMNAPVVVAKGKDLFARRISSIAREHGVPVLERKPLTRAIYALAEIGDEIPFEFYRAIAELLAHVYRIKNQYSLPKNSTTHRV